jgi:hypothetical protein
LFRRIILTAVLSTLAASALAQSGVPIGLPDTRRIEAFANGDIRHSAAADVYFLVVQAKDESTQFWLQCEKRGPFTVAIAMVGVGDKLQKSQLVTIQADRGTAKRLNLVVFENFVAIATRHEGKADENASIFLDALRAAKKTFTVSYAGESHDFEVSHLAAPHARFLAMCRQHAS